MHAAFLPCGKSSPDLTKQIYKVNDTQVSSAEVTYLSDTIYLKKTQQKPCLLSPAGHFLFRKPTFFHSAQTQI